MAYTKINATNIGGASIRVDNIGQAGIAGGVGFGHKTSNDGNLFLYINNSAANTPSITVLASGTFKGASLTSKNVVQATVANADYVIGPFDPSIYNDTSGDLLWFYTGSNETEIKVVPFWK